MKNLSFLIILLFTSLLKAEDIAVVVSNDFNAEQLTSAQIKRVFLAKTKRVNNTRVHIVEIKNALYKNNFYKKISGKSPAQLRSYWATLIFTGKAQPPKQMQNMQELVAEFSTNTKTIAYIPLSSVTKGMKVLYTLKD